MYIHPAAKDVLHPTDSRSTSTLVFATNVSKNDIYTLYGIRK